MAWMLVVILFFAGLIAGYKSGSRRLLRSAIAVVLGASIVVALVLARSVLAVDPGRDTGTIPLPQPWSSVLASLAIGLLIALPAVLGGVIGFSAFDFVSRRPWRWAWLVGSVVAFLGFAELTVWVFGVTVD